ncbi:3-deoxy-D-manno-octulosonic acid transferase [Candidatus Pelagibacter communis]|uniref:3-deoxy-D-manno-octulosonic acid transferase n=1 Tax=Pelagibacter ubique TaxID=198252 RepID=UPI00092CF606|nr:glycosyltransferase N-terminal domain-containing protein [Candidatus Pelagibacter ubique]
MILFYRFLINVIFILSPLIILIRLLKKRESPKRFKEKLGFFTKNRSKGKLIWFHGASVGELQSIVPLLEKLEKSKKISQILITSNTLSSSKIISKIKLKKILHQFFPIDNELIIKKFINHWKPSAAFFIDSEIWPNTMINLNKEKIPTILINARITKKSYKKWIKLKNFSKLIFNKFDLCLSSNKETVSFLKKLGAKNIKYFGNLKYSQSENEKIEIDSQTIKFISRKTVWCASSTHNSEEKFAGLIHKKLKKKYKNLLTVIIPRHIDRDEEIKEQLSNLGLKVHTHEPKSRINEDTDIYLVNAFGKTKSFYSLIKNIFLGGSLIEHGGQNPLEAVRYNCNILHGPNVSNFNEIYKFLNKQKISKKVINLNQTTNILNKLLNSKKSQKNIKDKINKIGQKIIEKNIDEINLILNKV